MPPGLPADRKRRVIVAGVEPAHVGSAFGEDGTMYGRAKARRLLGRPLGRDRVRMSFAMCTISAGCS